MAVASESSGPVLDLLTQGHYDLISVYCLIHVIHGDLLFVDKGFATEFLCDLEPSVSSWLFLLLMCKMRIGFPFWISERVSTCCAIPTNNLPCPLLSQTKLAAGTEMGSQWLH